MKQETLKVLFRLQHQIRKEMRHCSKWEKDDYSSALKIVDSISQNSWLLEIEEK